ncbi:hypothetical protein A2Z33_05060 [Candidatus Gottesmanbacteria bacterium RBG_16_52_11]|uniref:Uncharacterized protein n=1 Tax=Candidatus Gottesmanbacteria bacterium RBG_16_52_11 TaxID=1798374 RepID=A0A1F5YR80_9BACT|nr:MAG: hypothetical protein A2Z33_05060 [Candidatus Gottesmanbacteria bacterium RBG_16_52_11]
METATSKSTYIYHYREIPDWLRQSPKTFHLLAEFARRARRVEGDVAWNGENIHLLPRQFITGRIKLSLELGLTQGEYRSAYEKLVRFRLIRTIRATKRYTVGEYLADGIFGLNLAANQPSEQPSELPTSNQPTTTNNNENKDKNLYSRFETDKEKSPSYKNKPLSDSIGKIREKYSFLQKKKGGQGT